MNSTMSKENQELWDKVAKENSAALEKMRAVRVVVYVDDNVAFSQATGRGRETAQCVGCGQEELPTVLGALRNAVAGCEINELREA